MLSIIFPVGIELSRMASSAHLSKSEVQSEFSVKLVCVVVTNQPACVIVDSVSLMLGGRQRCVRGETR